jgi:hypothetical protein
MQKLLQASIFLALVGFTLPSLCFGTEGPDTRPITSPAVHGQLIKMEGNLFTIKAPTGQMRQLRIDQETKLVGEFRTGDYVQAWLLPDGRTESIIAYKDMGQTLPAQP